MIYKISERMEILLVQKGLTEDEAIAIVQLCIDSSVGYPWEANENEITQHFILEIVNRVTATAMAYCIENPKTLEAQSFMEKYSELYIKVSQRMHRKPNPYIGKIGIPIKDRPDCPPHKRVRKLNGSIICSKCKKVLKKLVF